jgi:hypothetical protein
MVEVALSHKILLFTAVNRSCSSIKNCHSGSSISFVKAPYTASLVCTETGAGPDLGTALTKGLAESPSGSFWGVAVDPLFSYMLSVQWVGAHQVPGISDL